MEVFDILSKVQNYAPVLGVLLALGLKVYWKEPAKYIFIYLLSSLILNILVGQFQIVFIFGRFILSLYDLFKLALWSWMFYEFSKGKKTFKYIGYFLLSTVLAIQLLFEQPGIIPSSTGTVAEIAIIMLCFIYFFHVYQKEEELKTKSALRFFTVCVLFILTAGGFFVSIMTGFIIKSGGANANLWFIQDAISIFSYVAFTFIIWKTKSYKTEQ